MSVIGGRAFAGKDCPAVLDCWKESEPLTPGRKTGETKMITVVCGISNGSIALNKPSIVLAHRVIKLKLQIRFAYFMHAELRW